MKDSFGRVQCFWMPPWLTRLYIERAAYARSGRPVLTDKQRRENFEAELAEVNRRLEKV